MRALRQLIALQGLSFFVWALPRPSDRALELICALIDQLVDDFKREDGR